MTDLVWVLGVVVSAVAAALIGYCAARATTPSRNERRNERRGSDAAGPYRSPAPRPRTPTPVPQPKQKGARKVDAPYACPKSMGLVSVGREAGMVRLKIKSGDRWYYAYSQTGIAWRSEKGHRLSLGHSEALGEAHGAHLHRERIKSARGVA